jgi:hypothetical protein
MTKQINKALAGVAALAAFALGGAAFAGAASRTATTTTPGTTTTPARPAGPAHGTAAHEDAEKPVTGDAATKAKAAAVKNVGSGTAGDVTSDFTGDGYEVTVTKPDGTATEVHLDKSFNVIQGGHFGRDGGQNDPPAPPASGTPPTPGSGT